MVYHPNEFETLVTRGQNKPLYCKVPDSLSESLARARLGVPPLATEGRESYKVTTSASVYRNHSSSAVRLLVRHQPVVGYKRGVGSHDLLARSSNGKASMAALDL